MHLKTSSLRELRQRTRMKLQGAGSRTGSFPFVSGDTFRAIADVIFENPGSSDIQGNLSQIHAQIAFCDVNTVPTLVGAIRNEALPLKVAVIHNGDHVDETSVWELSSLVDQVYCVNWMTGAPNIAPIPIGIENAWHRRNGKLSTFQDCIPAQRREALIRPRNINLLAGFNVATNPHARLPALHFAQQVNRGSTIVTGISPRHYQNLLSQSYFTLSPPGNGPDCHRTWEAIYRGSVPIVLRSAWPFPDAQLPVLVVDDWWQAEDLFRDQASLLETYSSITSIFPRHAFMQHWVADFAKWIDLSLSNNLSD